MDISKVEYSTRPVTLQTHIWMEQAGKGSFEAMFQLVLARTNLKEPETLALDDEELSEVIGQIGEGMARAFALSALGRSIDAEANG